ncbi:LacI family transcriptional regulator [Alkalihalophilus marmarensis]|jgi:LacI family transcriptional regulator|uniref:LacI family DNA-binding transcriptional regulator n=1 Tax=Alkalihalophilus marmarensis TaxID=521377 RepID=UPI002041F49C|nr:LacI family DNA-binding transcriptional regulator [Alkalihalophilus marmarensis]MCM3489874.1 LacI family transcriptional regulator [Alkalihalophilus marmarensis]
MKNITIKDVANKAGVSVGSVSKVLNNKGYVSKETREKVEMAIEALNYQVNAAARSLKASRTKKVGMLVSYISNPYLMSIAKTIEDSLRELGCHLLLMSHNEDEATERELLQLIMEQRVEALVLIPTGGNREMVQTVINQKIPVLLVDKKVEGVSTDLIVDDNYYGSYESIKYLSSLGHSRIGVIYGVTKNSVGKERLDGALDAIKDLECSLDESLVRPGEFDSEKAYKSATELLLLPNPPTAIYCCNNTMTTGLIKAINDRGIKIPDDISIITFGDASQWELLQPPLTLMTQPLKRIGVEAAILLKNRITMKEEYLPKQLIIRPELQIRSSCASPKVEVRD